MSNHFDARRVITGFAFAAALTGSVFAGCAKAAPQKTHFDMRGLAGFLESEDFFVSDVCSVTVYTASENQNVTHDVPGGRITSDFVRFQVQHVNFCTGQSSFLDVGGETSLTGNFQKGIHATASLSGMAWVDDGPPTVVTGTFDLTFTPTGKPERFRSSNFVSFGGTMQHFRSVGDDVSASVSGSLVVNGTDYLAVALAPGNAVFAGIENSNSSTLDIVKK